MKSNRQVLIMIFSIMLALGGAAAAHAQDSTGRKEFSLGMKLDSSTGVSSSTMFDFINTIIDVMNKEYGYDIQLKKFETDGAVVDALMNNELDAAWLGPGRICGTFRDGMNVRPWVTFIFGGNRKQASCVWHRKDGGISKPEDLLGKRTDYDSVDIVLRWHLAENGLDRPLYDVFESFINIPGRNSAFMALAAGQIDVLWLTEDAEHFIRFMNPGVFEKLEKSLCTEHTFARSGIIMNLNTVSEEDFRLTRNAIGQVQKNVDELADKYPELETLKAYMKMADIRMVPAEENEYDFDLYFTDELEKEIWRDEHNMVKQQIKAAPDGARVKVSPPLEFCQERCTKLKAQDMPTCIVECMD